jgi:hypothetical protein
MATITDQFRVGDKVKWTEKEVVYMGIIETITAAGHCALVRQPGKRLQLIGLSALEVMKCPTICILT